MFPVRHLNFSCDDASIAYSQEHGEATFINFHYYADISYTVVFTLCFAVPPFLVSRLSTLKMLVTTIDAQWEGMGDVGSARYEPALLPPCPTIRVLRYSN